jgi:hypothetical protein
MIVIRNNPELSEAFKSEEVREFFLNFLKDLEEPYNLKKFLKEGAEQTYMDQFAQLAKSFVPLKTTTEENGDISFLIVERCTDGMRFNVGEMVFDKLGKRKLPIGRMYEDERGLHVRLDVEPDAASITWRDLSQIYKLNKPE